MSEAILITGPYYKGEYRSAIARARRILIDAGFQWSTTSGRYSPFFNEQITTKGVRVTRIGCSETVTLHVYGEHDRGAYRALKEQALEALRCAGMPFDDRGWLLCGEDARKALKKAEGAP